jgi:hypothetical protein
MGCDMTTVHLDCPANPPQEFNPRLCRSLVFLVAITLRICWMYRRGWRGTRDKHGLEFCLLVCVNPLKDTVALVRRESTEFTCDSECRVR